MALDKTSHTERIHALLSDQDKKLLTELVKNGSMMGAGVEAKSFRAQNFQDLQAIERLENIGLISRVNERYFVDLIALPHLQARPATDILINCEKIFPVLKAHYLQNQTESITISEVAKRTGITLTPASIALNYMIHSKCIGGRSANLFSGLDSYVFPAEDILRFDSFSAVIEQQSSWRQNYTDPRLAMSSGSPLNFHDEGVTVRRQPLSDAYPVPTWISELPIGLQDLLKEVYQANANDLRALCSMGIRAAIDMVCVERVGDVGSFQKKLELMLAAKHISEIDFGCVLAAIEMGNASAHRGHIPSKEDLSTLLLICERLVSGRYVIPKGTEAMRGNTPARSSQPVREKPKSGQ